jgi:hypothetical protein
MDIEDGNIIQVGRSTWMQIGGCCGGSFGESDYVNLDTGIRVESHKFSHEIEKAKLMTIYKNMKAWLAAKGVKTYGGNSNDDGNKKQSAVVWPSKFRGKKEDK